MEEPMHPTATTPAPVPPLPGLDCGMCGVRTCADLAARLPERPELLARCVHLSGCRVSAESMPDRPALPSLPTRARGGTSTSVLSGDDRWRDTLGREFDFFLEHFPEDPGPREVILPHNPVLTRELEIAPGDLLIGRPLGMSCGCPITHCGVATEVDARTGVIVWCVTGPLGPREKGYKDLGYYAAEAYEGLVTESCAELEIGRRYFFQPRMCMLQWRHSGLVNFVARRGALVEVRLEGLWIG